MSNKKNISQHLDFVRLNTFIYDPCVYQIQNEPDEGENTGIARSHLEGGVRGVLENHSVYADGGEGGISTDSILSYRLNFKNNDYTEGAALRYGTNESDSDRSFMANPNTFGWAMGQGRRYGGDAQGARNQIQFYKNFWRVGNYHSGHVPQLTASKGRLSHADFAVPNAEQKEVTASFFNALMINRNGPYGYCTWKQIRAHENPVTRRQRFKNIFTVAHETGREFQFISDGGRIVTQREKIQLPIIQYRFESPVASSARPFIVSAGVYYRDPITAERQMKHVYLKTSLSNPTIFFNNQDLNDKLDLRVTQGKDYKLLKESYLNGALESNESMIDEIGLFVYQDIIYPRQLFTYKKFTRQRTSFQFPWKNNIEDRITKALGAGKSNDGFQAGKSSQDLGNQENSFFGISQSVWPLDVDLRTFHFPNTTNLLYQRSDLYGLSASFFVPGAGVQAFANHSNAHGNGILWNNYSFFVRGMGEGSGSAGISILSGHKANSGSAATGNGNILLSKHISPAPYYSRRHMIPHTKSVISPNGMFLEGINRPQESSASYYDEFRDTRIHQIGTSGNGHIQFMHDLPAGEAFWDAPYQAGKGPFYHSYEEYVQAIRKKGKDFTIVPEFRMSEHVKHYHLNGLLSDNLHMFEITGGAVQLTGSDETYHAGWRHGDTRTELKKKIYDFYDVYSTTDLMKNFDLVINDHKDFAEPAIIQLTCRAKIKFLPYKGFYPVQRTVQMAEQFYSSYKDQIQTSGSSGGIGGGTSVEHQNILTPLFAPGVLFNTIKSGVAVDYPVITSSILLGHAQGKTDTTFSNLGYKRPDDDGAGYYLRLNNMDIKYGEDFYHPTQGVRAVHKAFERIPFEALVDPRRYMAGFAIPCQEPHIWANTSGSAFLDGEGDAFYRLMAHNFLAEVGNFYLENKDYTTFYSKPNNDPSVGLAEKNRVYAMRVKMYKSFRGGRKRVSGSGFWGEVGEEAVMTPQYRYHHDEAKGDFTNPLARENFTMYSRPSAFGPPNKTVFHSFNGTSTELETSGSNGQTTWRVVTGSDSSKGENYPYTPPYYYGEAWADIYFKADETRKYSIIEILNSASAEPYNYTGEDMGGTPDHDPGNNMPTKYYRFSADGFVNNYKFQFDHISGAAFNPNSDAHGIGGNPKAYIKTHLYNINAMQLNSSVNLFGLERDQAGDLNEETTRWVIQTKFETPMLNFNHLTNHSDVTQPNSGYQAIPRGMWHQYGKIEDDTSKGIFMEIEEIPERWRAVESGHGAFTVPTTGSLIDLCGFDGDKRRLGQIKESKRVSEAIVAVPFVEHNGERKFFAIPRPDIEMAIRTRNLDQSTKPVHNSIYKMIERMQTFVFPPNLDFVHNKDVDPFAMYIIPFHYDFTKQELADMWQGLYPHPTEDPGVFHEKTAGFSHELLANALMGGGTAEGLQGNIPTSYDSTDFGQPLATDVRWMVFKVKQRADTDYFANIIGERNNIILSQLSNIYGEAPQNRQPITYNWPYDYFSIIELAQIEAGVTIANLADGRITPIVETPAPPEPDPIPEIIADEESGFTYPEVEDPPPTPPTPPPGAAAVRNLTSGPAGFNVPNNLVGGSQENPRQTSQTVPEGDNTGRTAFTSRDAVVDPLAGTGYGGND